MKVEEESKHKIKVEHDINDFSFLVFETKGDSDSSFQALVRVVKRYKKKKIDHKLLRLEYNDVLPESVR